MSNPQVGNTASLPDANLLLGAAALLSRTGQQPNVPQHSIAELVEAYVELQEDKELWSSNTKKEKLSDFAVLTEILDSHRPAINAPNQVTRDVANYVFSILKSYPKRRTQSAKFREKDLSVVLKIAGEDDLLSPQTINNYLASFSALFAEAARQEWFGVQKNPFDGLKVARKAVRRAANERDAYSDEELTKIFCGPVHALGKFDRPFEYWFLLIAMLSGARREEICQLRCSDIKLVSGVWVFHHTENHSTKSLKTESSDRLVPVHEQLLRLGLIEYRDRVMELNGKDAALFPELPWGGVTHGYGRTVGRFFLGEKGITRKGYLVQVGVKLGTEDRKDLHAFRHTLNTKLQEAGIHPEIREPISGHSGVAKSMNHRYSHGDLTKQMKEALDRVQFTEVLSKVRPFDLGKVRKLPKKVNRRLH